MDEETETRTPNKWVVTVVAIEPRCGGLPGTRIFGSLAEAQGYAAGLAKFAICAIEPDPVDV